MHSGTRDTSFNLNFGSDVVIPVEIGISTLQATHFDPKQNKDGIQANLNLLEETRENASIRVVAKQR